MMPRIVPVMTARTVNSRISAAAGMNGSNLEAGSGISWGEKSRSGVGPVTLMVAPPSWRWARRDRPGFFALLGMTQSLPCIHLAAASGLPAPAFRLRRWRSQRRNSPPRHAGRVRRETQACTAGTGISRIGM